jgi:hypothetical protein
LARANHQDVVHIMWPAQRTPTASASEIAAIRYPSSVAISD